MSRIARVVIPGVPHHIIQRGNRRQTVFFSDEDRKKYLEYLRFFGDKFGIKYWAYCLMYNHVHLIAVPETEESLARGIGEAHRKYTRKINLHEGWKGYLWQGRFASYPLDQRYLYAAVRYVERNPVRAGLVRKAEEYPWSSAKAHVLGQRDLLLSKSFLSEEIKDWLSFLQVEDSGQDVEHFKRHARTGRPLCDETFLTKLEMMTGRTLRKKKPGPKKER